MFDFSRLCYGEVVVGFDAEIQGLIARLKLAARKARVPLKELSVRCGFNPHYLTQLLGGSARLTLRVVLKICAEVELAPVALFADLYGFTDLLPLSVARREAPPRPLDVDFEVERLRDRLWVKIAESEVSQREVARRMGEHPDYVNQVLRGNLELKVEHVLGILAALKVQPAAFFEELYGVGGRLARLADLDEELFPGVTRRELMRLFQQGVRDVRTAQEARDKDRAVEEKLARRRAARERSRAGERPSPPRGEEAAEEEEASVVEVGGLTPKS